MKQRLPLLDYLCFQPLQFGRLQPINLQVSNDVSVCMVVIKPGLPFRTYFSADEVAEIEERASWFVKMPEIIELGYSSEPTMSFLHFLYLLRLNIILKVAQL